MMYDRYSVKIVKEEKFEKSYEKHSNTKNHIKTSHTQP